MKTKTFQTFYLNLSLISFLWLLPSRFIFKPTHNEERTQNQTKASTYSHFTEYRLGCFVACLFFAVIIGSHPDHPVYSCKHIRDIGISTGGEYWIDPERNGNPLKVYCDMTTDGGRFRNVLYTEENIDYVVYPC